MKTKSLGYSEERGGIPLRQQPRGLCEDDGFDWDVTRPLREQWPWCYPNSSARAMEAVAEFRAQIPVAGDPALTPEETAAIIAQSSDSYEPKP